MSRRDQEHGSGGRFRESPYAAVPGGKEGGRAIPIHPQERLLVALREERRVTRERRLTRGNGKPYNIPWQSTPPSRDRGSAQAIRRDSLDLRLCAAVAQLQPSPDFTRSPHWPDVGGPNHWQENAMTSAPPNWGTQRVLGGQVVIGLSGSHTTLACGPFGLVSNVAHPEPTTPGCAWTKQCWPLTEPQHSLFAGQSLGPSHVMFPGDTLSPQYTWLLNPLVHPSDTLQVIVAPSFAEQLTSPDTSIVPRQNPPGAEQPPGTQSAAVLQSLPSAGNTHEPCQQLPRTWPGREHRAPFGVFPPHVQMPAEQTSWSPQPIAHPPQYFGSV